MTPLKDLRMPWAFELDAEVHRKEKWGHTLVENVQFESDLKRWISVRSSSSIAIWGSGRQHPAAAPCPQGGGSVWFALSLLCRYRMLLWIGGGLQLWFHSLGRKHFSVDRSWDYCSSGEGVLCTVSCTWTVPLHRTYAATTSLFCVQNYRQWPQSVCCLRLLMLQIHFQEHTHTQRKKTQL